MIGQYNHTKSKGIHIAKPTVIYYQFLHNPCTFSDPSCFDANIHSTLQSWGQIEHNISQTNNN